VYVVLAAKARPKVQRADVQVSILQQACFERSINALNDALFCGSADNVGVDSTASNAPAEEWVPAVGASQLADSLLQMIGSELARHFPAAPTTASVGAAQHGRASLLVAAAAGGQAVAAAVTGVTHAATYAALRMGEVGRRVVEGSCEGVIGEAGPLLPQEASCRKATAAAAAGDSGDSPAREVPHVGAAAGQLADTDGSGEPGAGGEGQACSGGSGGGGEADGEEAAEAGGSSLLPYASTGAEGSRGAPSPASPPVPWPVPPSPQQQLAAAFRRWQGRLAFALDVLLAVLQRWEAAVAAALPAAEAAAPSPGVAPGAPPATAASTAIGAGTPGTATSAPLAPSSAAGGAAAAFRLLLQQRLGPLPPPAAAAAAAGRGAEVPGAGCSGERSMDVDGCGGGSSSSVSAFARRSRASLAALLSPSMTRRQAAAVAAYALLSALGAIPANTSTAPRPGGAAASGKCHSIAGSALGATSAATPVTQGEPPSPLAQLRSAVSLSHPTLLVLWPQALLQLEDVRLTLLALAARMQRG